MTQQPTHRPQPRWNLRRPNNPHIEGGFGLSDDLISPPGSGIAAVEDKEIWVFDLSINLGIRPRTTHKSRRRLGESGPTDPGAALQRFKILTWTALSLSLPRSNQDPDPPTDRGRRSRR